MAARIDPGAGPQERFFAALLRLFPADFRERFADEMRTLFHDQQRDARDAGRLAYVRFFSDTCRGLVATAFREHREILFQDADYAFRLMRKDLSFTIVVIAILGMAIGASTAAFMAANAISDPASTVFRRQSPDTSATAAGPGSAWRTWRSP